MNFETVKKNYDKGLWTAALVKMAVRKGIITKEQYKEITGKNFMNFIFRNPITHPVVISKVFCAIFHIRSNFIKSLLAIIILILYF